MVRISQFAKETRSEEKGKERERERERLATSEHGI